ncbi:recombination regulator RecX [Clostridium hydrogenum]|uniref:recombination regulator RecX n=1 Tax=Clostridium hydrogenum TaxID=2855764 RepID=UPI002E340274|nr:recombination regulator RecX [Clostridium hydrogenum]
MQGVITKIEVQKNKKDRVNVYIDEEYSFSCSMELVYSHGLKKNKLVDMDEIKDVVSDDNYIYCKETALKIIERTLKTEKEVEIKLRQKGFEENLIDKAINFLKKYDFVNDNKYIKCYVKEKIKKDGKNKIKYNLMKKGIREDLIEKELNEVNIDKQQYSNTLMELARKKYEILSKKEDDKLKVKKKTCDYLLRKGYLWEEIKPVLNDLLKINYLET